MKSVTILVKGFLRRNKIRKTVALLLISIILASMLSLFIARGRAEEVPNNGPIVFNELDRPGHIEGTGTYFALNDSTYLNVTLESSEPIRLILEVVPEIVTMHIESMSDADSCLITLRNLNPQMTYYKYEDDYYNQVTLVTDEYGTYCYTQDLADMHYVFIQTASSTKTIRDDASGGDATSIGTWDNVTKTCTLTMDVYETIVIADDGITLDGDGYTVEGSGLTHGIYLNRRSDVTVKNLVVKNFNSGIYFYVPTRATVTNNTVLDNIEKGIALYASKNSTVTGNRSPTGVYGIYIYGGSIYSTITNNNITGNSGGIHLGRTSYDLVADNTACNNLGAGISGDSSQNNVFTNNNVSHNKYGIRLFRSSDNTITDNVVSSNALWGIAFSGCRNTITMNIATGNKRGIVMSGASSGPYLNSNNTVTQNTFNFNTEYGISTSIIFNTTITHNNCSSNGVGGVSLHKSVGNNISNNHCLDNIHGILLSNHANNNTIAGNTCNMNNRGIYLALYANYNTIMDNTFAVNDYGLYAYYSFNNTVYNNNFINNPTQAYAVPVYNDNRFNHTRPVGGNYWSDWTTPDVDNNGFVDFPYIFTTGQDHLPWARESGWADNTPPFITITTPQPYGLYTIGMALDFAATDDESGVDTVVGKLTNTTGTSQEVDSGFQPLPGVYTLVVTATDVAGNTGESNPVFFVVYDPEGGFATGGGWILPDAESTLPDGKANFGFVAKHKQGSSTGNLEFQYHDAGINLKSTTVDWLVVTSVSAQFQGTGTINGDGVYTFRVTVKDLGEPGVGVDQFDIKIWQGTGTEAEPIHKAKNTISGGNIVVHKK